MKNQNNIQPPLLSLMRELQIKFKFNPSCQERTLSEKEWERRLFFLREENMANQRYGLPYKGSKNKIAEWVVASLPPAEHFYDLFCGGCSITHAALKSGKYKGRFFANDIIGELPRLFIKAAHGRLNIDYHFVTRDEFFEKKEENLLIKLCYSFGMKGDTYIYGKDNEDFKHAYHDAVVFKRFDALKEWGFDITSIATQKSVIERYVSAKRILRKRERNVDLITEENLPRLQGVERLQHIEELQHLEELESLGRLESLRRLESLERPYYDVNIIPNSTVYCDIPYFATSGYGNKFDHKEFYQWALSRDFPVFVSEYWMPDDFTCIAMKGKRVTFANNKNDTLKAEKIFVQKKYADKYKRDLFL